MGARTPSPRRAVPHFLVGGAEARAQRQAGAMAPRRQCLREGGGLSRALVTTRVHKLESEEMDAPLLHQETGEAVSALPVQHSFSTPPG